MGSNIQKIFHFQLKRNLKTGKFILLAVVCYGLLSKIGHSNFCATTGISHMSASAGSDNRKNVRISFERSGSSKDA
jgi:hypothetical protein